MNEIRIQRPEGERLSLLYPAPSQPAAAILFLGGTGATPAWAAEESRLPEIAPAAGFHLIVPEATRPQPGEPPRFIANPPRWNDGSPAPTPQMHTDVDDAGFLKSLIDRIIENGLADPRRIYVTGFSNGAGMAFRLAAEHSEIIAAIAPVAGLWWPQAKPSRPVPTLYVLGSHDPLIPYRGGEVQVPWSNRLVRRPPALQSLEAWAAAIGCESQSIVISDRAGIREELYPPLPGAAEFRAIFVEGLGHHWPGGKGQLNRRIAGPTADTLDLNPRLLNFFRNHSL